MRSRGFTLVEVVVALLVVGIALLVASAAVQRQILLDDRLEARREALAILESAYEGVRGGELSRVPGIHELAVSTPVGSRLESVALSAEVIETEESELQRVDLLLRWRWRGEAFREELSTMVLLP